MARETAVHRDAAGSFVTQVVDVPDDKIYLVLARGAKPPTSGGVANIGGHHSVHLPSVETQRAGFGLRVEHAKALLAQFPDLYKRKLSGAGSKQKTTPLSYNIADSQRAELTEWLGLPTAPPPSAKVPAIPPPSAEQRFEAGRVPPSVTAENLDEEVAQNAETPKPANGGV